MAEDKPKTINEEAGLPDNWIPVDAPPIVPGTSAPTTADGSSKYFTGSLPPGFQHDVSFTGTAYKQDRTPQLSLMPLGIQGNPSTNAGSQSTSGKVSNNQLSLAFPGVVNSAGSVQAATLDNIGDSTAFGRVSQTALANHDVDPSLSGVLAKGSTPVTQNTGISYTSTTNSINLIWNALALYKADNAVVNIGSSSQNVTGLGSALTFYAFPYYDEPTASFKFVSNSDVSFPSISGIAFATNQEVTTTTSAALTTAFSVSVWMKVASGYAGAGGLNTNTAQTGAIVSANSVFNLAWSAGQVTAAYRDSGGVLNTITTPLTYNDGEWHHFVYTCSPATSSQILYADGVAVATGTVATGVSATSAYYRLVKDDLNIFMTGTMTEVSVYSVALTAVQVAAQFNSMNSISQSAFETVVISQAPTIWWKMGETSGTLTDSGSIGSNTGNTTNSPLYSQLSPSFGAVGSPAILWPNRSLLVSQAQAIQSRVPFSVGGWAVATTSGGTGGGTNGGSAGGTGTGCFSGNTLIQMPSECISIDKLKVGDVIVSNKGNRRVLAIHHHDAVIRKMIDMGNGEFVTPNHIICHENEWTSAGEVLRNNADVYLNIEVFNLSIEADDFDGRSFLLANGILAHNSKLV